MVYDRFTKSLRPSLKRLNLQKREVVYILSAEKLVTYHLRRLYKAREVPYAKYAKRYVDGSILMTNGFLLIYLDAIEPSHEWDNSYLGVDGGTHGGGAVEDWPSKGALKIVNKSPSGTTAEVSRVDLAGKLKEVKARKRYGLSVVDGVLKISDASLTGYKTKAREILVNADYLKQISLLAKQLREPSLTFTLEHSLRPVYVKLGKHTAVIAPMAERGA